jgi:uncharacterized protein (TIGR00730 family)
MSRKTGEDRHSSVVSLSDEEQVKDVVVDAILNLWEAVNNLTRLRPSKKERYRVTIFGSARVPKGSWVYNEVTRLARELSGLGCDIVTGGGPGLMQAANEGARDAGSARGSSLGVRVDLPFEQAINPFVEQTFEHRTFFTRLHQFVLMSDAFVVVPGGIGTALETFMVWQLLQVRHLDNRVQLILIGKMYAKLVAWAREHMLDSSFPLANLEDMEIPICVDTADEAIALIRQHHASWKKGQPGREKTERTRSRKKKP